MVYFTHSTINQTSYFKNNLLLTTLTRIVTCFMRGWNFLYEQSHVESKKTYTFDKFLIWDLEGLENKKWVGWIK